jgi:hypothetical protein
MFVIEDSTSVNSNFRLCQDRNSPCDIKLEGESGGQGYSSSETEAVAEGDTGDYNKQAQELPDNPVQDLSVVTEHYMQSDEIES